MNKNKKRKLIVFENRVLGNIFCKVYKNRDWRIQHNKEIINLHRDRKITVYEYVRTRRLRWAGNVFKRQQRRLSRNRRGKARLGYQPSGSYNRIRGRPRKNDGDCW